MNHLYGDLNIQKYFDAIKKITSASILKYYGPRRSLVLQTDATFKGLGALFFKKATQYTLPVKVSGHTKKDILQLNLSLLQLLGPWRNSIIFM